MKILIVVDKTGTAIDRLAQLVKKYLPQHQIKVRPIHPKRNDIDTLIEIQKLMIWCDILDIHYWKSGQVLRTSFPKEFEAKPRILFHMNPYNVINDENQYYSKIVVGNQTIQNNLPSAELIPYGIDLDFFKFNLNYTNKKIVNMAVSRIEKHKGVLEVAQACKKLGYGFHLVGRVSKSGYMREVMEAGRGIIKFWENATDEKVREVYYSSAVHVCNSVDFYESGTLPILENLACGVPVLTRNIGHVPDLYNGKNMIVRKGQYNDLDDLVKNLHDLMENEVQRLRLRKQGWQTVKNRNGRKMANQINQLYYDMVHKTYPLVSIIIPTRDNPEAFLQSFIGALKQDYPKFEIIVVDSGDISVEPIIKKAKKFSNVPIRYVKFAHRNAYTLAEARNRATILADGKYLLFCDDRIKMDATATTIFYENYQARSWLWGMKDGVIKGFVENFSFVSRRELIDKGMFNERMQFYGGMSQEIRTRFGNNGFNFVFIKQAKAKGIKRSKSKIKRYNDIIKAKFLLYQLYEK